VVKVAGNENTRMTADEALTQNFLLGWGWGGVVDVDPEVICNLGSF
jgi:hypothetical protein